MPDHNYFSNLMWQVADLLRGPYRPPQYERVMLPMTVLRRFDCVLAPTKAKVLTEFEKRKGGKLEGDALDTNLNKAGAFFLSGRFRRVSSPRLVRIYEQRGRGRPSAWPQPNGVPVPTQ